MFKQLVNECVIDLHIKPDGPVLIKSGIATVNGPDMAFVTVLRNGDWEVYLPGSSLKGVLRSHAERIARTFNREAACDPFGKKEDPESSCSACFDKRKESGESDLKTPTAYQDSCLICQLFGSTWVAGRLATTDAYAVGEPPQPQRRDGVGIDRFTGGAAYGAKFELEVITEGVFATTLHLRNFELWQLALVGFLLQDLKDCLIRIGMGKSRGLGKARGEVKSVRLDFLGPKAPQVRDGCLPLRGVGSLFEEAEVYGMTTPDEVSISFESKLTSHGVRTTAVFPGDTFPWAQIVERWVNRVQSYSMPEPMRRYRGGGQR
jgi:CRISPR-associated RAMP protein (TIGR02581 family)